MQGGACEKGVEGGGCEKGVEGCGFLGIVVLECMILYL